ncbi:MAG: hypothetical protein JWQ29_1740 [Phenylobacterium sp.]|nr:hypothetical protein [Phenylobacterium sp.]
MPSDRAADPWGETNYNGFSGPREPRPRPAHGRLPPLSRNLIVGGVAAAVGLGLVLGIAARPDIGQHDLKPTPMQPVAAPSGVLDVEVNRPVVLPAPRPTGRLEVLPPDLASSAPRMVAATPRQDPAPARIEPQPAALPVDPAPAAPHIQPRPAANASFDCRSAGSAAEQTVCGDPGLGRADRRLQRAYERAMQSGAMPPGELRAEQQDWLSIREEAARRSPDAVRSIYEQRIDELNALADDGPG